MVAYIVVYCLGMVTSYVFFALTSLGEEKLFLWEGVIVTFLSFIGIPVRIFMILYRYHNK